MRRLTVLIACSLSILPAAPALALTHKGWDTASTIGEGTLAVFSLGVPAVQSDWTGVEQAGVSLLVGGGSAYGLKQLVHERRPDGNGNDSFPSAHSAVSFAAAATLERRYGWQAGLPAFALASFVGVARIEAKRHFWYDVVAGAAMGSVSGFLLTSPRDANVRLVPWASHSGGGMAVSARF